MKLMYFYVIQYVLDLQTERGPIHKTNVRHKSVKLFNTYLATVTMDEAEKHFELNQCLLEKVEI